MVTQPRKHVAAPTFAPLPFGLLDSLSAVIRSPADEHWRNGVIYETLCAAAATTYDDCFAVSGTGGAAAPPPGRKEPTAELATRGATPFTVYAEVDCSVPGFWDRADELIEQTLLRAEVDAVERAFWTGIANGQPVVYPHLAADSEVAVSGLNGHETVLQTVATVVSGNFDVVEALGRLESALAECYHGVGVIHVPRILGPALAEARLLIPDGPRYKTPNGNIVVLGSGYPGTAPDGTPPGDLIYMYATGAMFIYRSRVFTTPDVSTVNRATNLQSIIAERTYVLGWECCHIAVAVNTDFLGGSGLDPFDLNADSPLLVTDNSDGTITFSMVPGTDGQYLATVGDQVEWETAGQPGTLAGPLDGSGKIPADQLPPLALHETFEAANQAEMLAAPVNAPSLAIRTDFSPAHLFYLHTDPATDINNWEDLGAGISAGADPTGQVGLVAVNGAAATYMRSDAAPALNPAVYAQTVTASTLAQRTNTSTLRAADPTTDDDLTTRRYVHDLLGSSVVTGIAVVNSVNQETGDVTVTPVKIGAVRLIGDTMTGPLLIDQNVQGIKARLAMKLPGSQNDAPTTFGVTATYLGLGGGEWNGNSYRLIGFGYIAAAGNQYPGIIGYQETSTSSNTRGDLVFATRPNNNNVAPTIILRINSAGQILAEAGAAYVPGSDGALTTRKYVHDLLESSLVSGGPGGLQAPVFHNPTLSDDITLSPGAVPVHLIDTTAASSTVIVNLPDALDNTTPGKTFTIKKVNAGGNGISIDGGEANIDGTASIGMNDQSAFRTMIFDGTNWQIIGTNGS